MQATTASFSSSSGLGAQTALSSGQQPTATAPPTTSTPLRPVTDSNGFTYPAIWSFPPFFTLQPNAQTFSHQLGLWTHLFLSYCKHYRIFTIDVTAEDGGARLGGLFWNQSIRRRLQQPAIKQLVAHLLKEGLVAPDPPKQSPSPATYLIYWRKPQEWAKLLIEYVDDNGLKGSIMTFYEITDGDMKDFQSLPHPLLRQALDVLVKQGKASVFKGEDGMEGVKFF